MKWKHIMIGAIAIANLALIALMITSLFNHANRLFVSSVQQFMDDPRLITIFTIPLMIPMRNSSKNPFYLRYYETIVHSDFAGVTEIGASFDVPMDCYVLGAKTRADTQTAFDVQTLMAHAWTGLGEDDFAQGLTQESWHEQLLDVDGAGEIVETLTPYPVTYFHINNNEDTNIQHEYSLFKFVRGGSTLRSRIFIKDQSTAATAGTLEFISELHLVPVNYNRSGNRHRSQADGAPPFVNILWRNPDTSSHYYHWVPPCDGRIVNTRITLFRWATDGDYFFAMDTDPDVPATTEGAVEHSAKNYLSINLREGIITPANDPNKNTVTKYRNDELFVNKNEPVSIMSKMSANVYAHLEFQFIPDYLNRFDFTSRYAPASLDTDDEFQNMFTVPFDMYVEGIEIDLMVEHGATPDKNFAIWVMSLKTGHISTMATPHSGYTIVQGNVLGMSGNTGPLPNNIHDVITAGTETANEVVSRNSVCSIMDFYEAGSTIGIYLPDEIDPANIAGIQIAMHITGTVQVKTDNRGRSYLRGNKVADMNELEMVV